MCSYASELKFTDLTLLWEEDEEFKSELDLSSKKLKTLHFSFSRFLSKELVSQLLELLNHSQIQEVILDLKPEELDELKGRNEYSFKIGIPQSLLSFDPENKCVHFKKDKLSFTENNSVATGTT